MGRFQMSVNEWVESFWAVLNVRPKTLHDYKRLYKRHLAPSIGAYEIDPVPPMVLQQKLLSLPPQTSLNAHRTFYGSISICAALIYESFLYY